MAYIEMVGGKTYNGKTVWSIIRRVYGRSKSLRVMKHPKNSPTWGTILSACEYGGYIVMGEIYDADGPMGIDNEGEDQDEEWF